MSLESTWDFHCNSTPRCISVDIAPSVPSVAQQGSNTTSSGGNGTGASGSGNNANNNNNNNNNNNKHLRNPYHRNIGFGSPAPTMPSLANTRTAMTNSLNPFDDAFANQQGGGGGRGRSLGPSPSPNPTSTGASSSNPFDDVYTYGQTSGRERDNQEYGNDVSASASFSSSMMSTGCTVLLGTERGTIHSRTFPTRSRASTRPYQLQPPKQRMDRFSSSGGVIHPYGYDMDGNEIVSGVGTGTGTGRTTRGGSGRNSSSSSVHPLYKPIDATPGKNYPIMACIKARKDQNIYSNGAGTASGSSGSMSIAENTTSSSGPASVSTPSSQEHPIYLILQDDKKSSSSSSTKQDSNPGIYSAKILSIHPPTHINTNTNTTNFTSPVVNDKLLPRMSCATYHPNCGYVYCAGSSIHSLPARAVRAVASALHGHGVLGSSQGLSSSLDQHAHLNPLSLPSIYYNAVDILPATVRPGTDSMACVCNGRVVVAAVGNSFYAVSGTNVPHGTWYTKEEEEKVVEEQMIGGTGTGVGTGTGGSNSVRVGFGNLHDTNDDYDEDDYYGDDYPSKGHDFEKVLSFRQSSQVHPAIVVEIPLANHRNEATGSISGAGLTGTVAGSLGDMEEEISTSLVFLASGRECAAVELLYNPRLYSNSGHRRPTSSMDDPMDRMLMPSSSVSCGSIVVGSPRHGIATLASPILAALGLQSKSSRGGAGVGPLMAILTSDGLVHTRSPSCIAIPLSTIEVGTRPNDYFTLKALPNKQVVAASYGGEGRLISFKEDTVQDLADRMMKLSIDAFGSNGFPRSEFAEAVGATFSATSYVGPEHTNAARTILRQYLEMILGLDVSGDFGGTSDANSWLFSNDGLSTEDRGDSSRKASQSPHVSTFLSATALLCLVCTRLSPPNPTLANRAAKTCASKLGVVSDLEKSGIKTHAVKLCDTIVRTLLIESESSSSASVTPTRGRKNGIQIEMIEAATWLLRSCGQHEKAIEILRERMSNPTIRNKTIGGDNSDVLSPFHSPGRRNRDGWSQLKYESFTATHLSELWSYGDDTCRDLVLNSTATRQLLESNPMLGLGVFTASHPNNSEQWSEMLPHDDPAVSSSYPMKVVDLLKSICPLVPNDKKERAVQIQSPGYLSGDTKSELPLESGRALTSSYLESLIGISSNRPPKVKSLNPEEDVSTIHNELALLLLEGVLSERGDDETEDDSDLGAIYRSKLRRLLGWANVRVSPDKLMSALPTSFLREKALLLGQLGRHEDALRIFYSELKSLDLALEYCDARFEKQQAQMSHLKRYPGGREAPDSRFDRDKGCAYLPLVAVALECDSDSAQGLEAAIKVLSLRRENIDRAAALRLLPTNIPVSVLSRSFLIPALIDSESQARRLTVVSSLLRSKYVSLKHKLTEAQIKSQSSLHTVPALKSLNLDEPVYSSNPFKARPSSVTTSHFPDITLVKYFFPRYVIIQAMVTNSAVTLDGKSLGDVQLIVAESSDEALLPSINVPIQTLPSKMTGSSWCVLAASPQRLDGTAILACELRYRVLEVDTATGAPLSFSGGFSRSFVEEIQDIEIRRAEFKLDDIN